MTVIRELDSRRLTGPNLHLDRPGAVLDVECPPDRSGALIAAWEEAARRMIGELGWGGEELASRAFPGGATLVISAPIDGLYAATEVNEWAFEVARARLTGEVEPDFDEAAERLRGEIAGERNPALMRLQGAADERGVQFLIDDDTVSIGAGRGSLSFPLMELPAPEAVDWSQVFDVPIAVITGTNGKSTTVRLLASMAEAAGLTPGYSSTDGVVVGGKMVEAGDYSGPEGARRVLRDRRVDLAVLETARGGLLRRGLGVRRADAALVTNVAEDHLGEWGVGDLAGLARTKLIVRHAVGAESQLVLNAEDEELRRHAGGLGVPLAWFALDRENETVFEQVTAGGDAAWLAGETLMLASAGYTGAVVSVGEIPIALGGAARHNVANALAAMLVAARLGLHPEAMADGLRRFGGSPAENPGRGNVFELGGVTAIVDFAHNPQGFEALFAMANSLQAKRRLVLIGQAGDRDDEAIRNLARATWRGRPDRIVVKEMKDILRGREEGEVPDLIESELRRLGAPADTVVRADSEVEAVKSALAWAEPGDLLLLLSHAERGAVLDLMSGLDAAGWQPGDELPD